MNKRETDYPKRILLELTAGPDGARSPLQYRLTEGRVDDRPSYDITCRAEGDWYQSEATVTDVTSERETGERLLTALWQGGVTPYALRETVIEWLLSQ